MGTKPKAKAETEELVGTVKSIIGCKYTDMDVIRALHMANNNPTVAINILFDTKKRHSFTTNITPNLTQHTNSNIKTNINTNYNNTNTNTNNDNNNDSKNEFWFVGSGEVAGLSTSKGKTINIGEEVTFSIPLIKNKHKNKYNIGVKNNIRPCSEIMRFSTHDSGESNVGVHSFLLHANKCNNPSLDGTEGEHEECISDADLDNIVGVGVSSDLEESEPPPILQCELRPYQKQALYWMIHLEKGKGVDEAATTLHPCWEAYHLADKKNLVLYLNAFTGEATTEFPQMARGGVRPPFYVVFKCPSFVDLSFTF